MSSPPNTLVLNHLLFLTTPITCHCCYHFDPCITHFIMSAIFISFPILFYYKLPYFALSFFSQFTLLPLYYHYNPPCLTYYLCMPYYYILQTHFLANPCPPLPLINLLLLLITFSISSCLLHQMSLYLISFYCSDPCITHCHLCYHYTPFKLAISL